MTLVRKDILHILVGPVYFGVNRHPKGIESEGFIYVPIFSWILRAGSMRL